MEINNENLSFVGMLKGLCPNCKKEKMFKSSVGMHDTCPSCGFKFERETGYFLGAMHFSYVWAGAVLIGFIFLLTFIFPDVREYKLVPYATILMLPFVPLAFRYSRIVWLYFDLYFDRLKKR